MRSIELQEGEKTLLLHAALAYAQFYAGMHVTAKK